MKRFWKKFKITAFNKCWEWLGGINKDGYGKFKIGGATILAHRMSYELAVGEIPPMHFVCHTCNNPSCVNPVHLWIGTVSDNNRDAIAKGRQLIRNNAKIDVKTVKAIRQEYKEKHTSHRKLAEKFNISKAQITRILNNQSWTWI